MDGFALQDDPQLIAGGLLVAALALLTERGLAAVERGVTSPGIRMVKMPPSDRGAAAGSPSPSRP